MGIEKWFFQTPAPLKVEFREEEGERSARKTEDLVKGRRGVEIENTSKYEREN